MPQASRSTTLELEAPPHETRSVIPPEGVERTVGRLTERHGPGQAGRIRRGVGQVAQRWWAEDGDAEAFAAFCEESFLADPAEVDETYRRLVKVFEQVDGHLHEVRRHLSWPVEVETGPLTAVDQLLATVDLAAHVEEDLFRSRVAFLALLNFPVHTLKERLEEGTAWDRETWARSRLMDRFAARVPASVQQEHTRTFVAAERYISSYNIRLDRLITPDGERLFPEGLRLISHWGLRDELASYYVNPTPQGLARQRVILRVMERIVRQEIPKAVIDNPGLLWDPETNAVRPAVEGEAEDTRRSPEREPDTRYATLLDIFHTVRTADPFSPAEPTFVLRRFERDRQIPESEVEALLVSVLASPEVAGAVR